MACRKPATITARKVGHKYAPVFKYADGSTLMVWPGVRRRYTGPRFNTATEAIAAAEEHLSRLRERNAAVMARFKRSKE